MNKRIEGKRWSKREITEYESWEEALQDPAWRHAEDSSLTLPGLDTRLAAAAEGAREVLRKHGLPDSAKVYWRDSSKTDEWQTTPIDWRSLTTINGVKMQTIEKYVRSIGYERDSLVDLCARVLVEYEKFLNNTSHGARLEAAFELGQILAYARAYGLESIINAKRQRKQRSKRGIWREIEKASKRETLEDSWRHLYSLLDQYYRVEETVSGSGLQYLYWDDDGKKQTITKKQFGSRRSQHRKQLGLD